MNELHYASLKSYILKCHKTYGWCIFNVEVDEYFGGYLAYVSCYGDDRWLRDILPLVFSTRDTPKAEIKAEIDKEIKNSWKWYR